MTYSHRPHYIAKLNDVLNDKSLSAVSALNGSHSEIGDVHAVLRSLPKKKELDDATGNNYSFKSNSREFHLLHHLRESKTGWSNTCGTRMHDVPKVHKANAPPQPIQILSLVKSPQHTTAQWLAILLKPVSERFSTYTIEDSFTFADVVKKVRHAKGCSCSAHMSSLDIKSLHVFTNSRNLCAGTVPFRP